MIRMKWIEHRACPVVICDACGKRIENHHDGVIVFRNFERNSEEDVLHAHKGSCHRAVEARFGSDRGWWPLGEHLNMLCGNVGIDQAEFAKIETWVTTRQEAGI